MNIIYDKLDPLFLTTRETFPGEKSFHELAAGFFGGQSRERCEEMIIGKWNRDGLLVHMANPEQLDDLFAHIDREEKVRFLSTSYLHADIRSTVYAIGRGTGIILDGGAVRVEHVSYSDSATVTDPDGYLVVSDHARLPDVPALHRRLKDDPQNEWSEVNVSFDGPAPIVGIFALDGALSKLYATVLHLKSGRLLPVFAYNREINLLYRFVPTSAAVARLAETVPADFRGRYRTLVAALEDDLVDVARGRW